MNGKQAKRLRFLAKQLNKDYGDVKKHYKNTNSIERGIVSAGILDAKAQLNIANTLKNDNATT